MKYLILIIFLISISLVSANNFTLEITEFLPDPIGKDDENMPNGEFIELYNYGNQSIDLFDFYFKDLKNYTLKISDINSLNGTILEPSNYLTVYKNKAYFSLNNKGLEEIRLYYNETLIDKVSYSDVKEGLSWSKVDGTWQIRNPSPGIENYKEEPITESILEIEKIYLGNDDKAKFGDMLRVKVNIYKGDTTKNSIKLYVDEISKTTSFNVFPKFTNYNLTLPVQLIPNCKEKYDDGEYELILEGLDTETSKSFVVEGITKDLCEKIKVEKEVKIEEKCDKITNNTQKEITENNLNNTSQGTIIYESEDVKAKRSALLFFCGLLTLIIITISQKND
jgi:hypothetical protein